MGFGTIPKTTFDNVFDLVNEDITRLDIRATHGQDNCYIWDLEEPNKCYSSLILDSNSKTKIVCDISFYKSSKTDRYIPRLTFKKVNTDNTIKEIAQLKPIIIPFDTSEKAFAFWKLIGFLNKYKEIVDLGEFEGSYKVTSKSAYFVEFESESEAQQIESLKQLVLKADLSESNIKSVVFESRRENLKAFYYLLKNVSVSGKGALEHYIEKFSVTGEEGVWHHFLKKHDWILGLNVDIKFIRDLYDEQKVGVENSRGKGSPKVDLLGISDYTTLIELKRSNTPIFKRVKSQKSRTDTWDFTSDFIEGVSQCLGQKCEFDRNYAVKTFVDDNGRRLDKERHRTIDPKTVFIIGNRKLQFPHDGMNDNYVKSETFERYRRNSRNVDVITYDELFERAYHVVYSERIPEEWYTSDAFEAKMLK